VLLAARTTEEAGRPRTWAVYDAGQAAAHLTVQAEAEGLSVHQMGGFHPAASREQAPRVRLPLGRLLLTPPDEAMPRSA
jgi:nitroreductase